MSLPRNVLENQTKIISMRREKGAAEGKRSGEEREREGESKSV